jgi:predicted HTH transcriptional regulator
VLGKEFDLGAFNLHERQLDALKFFKNAGEISTPDYMKRYNVSKHTASCDFAELVEKKSYRQAGREKTDKVHFCR